MNFILRGLLTLKEKKGRAIILLCIMITVSVVMLSSFAIQSGANAAAVLARQKLGATITISQDMQKMMQKQRAAASTSGTTTRVKMERTAVPLSYIDTLSSNKHISGYLATNSSTANLASLKPVGSDGTLSTSSSTTTSSSSTSSTKSENSNREGGFGGMRMMGMGDVKIQGVNDYKMTSEYVAGTYKLASGRAITKDDLGKNVVMIESTFAQENSIKVGDKFSINSVSFGNSSESSSTDTTTSTVTVEVEVVGIYTSSETIDSMGFNNSSSLPYNKFIAPYTLVSTLGGSSTTTGVDSIEFYLDDPANVDAFVKEAKANSAIDTTTYSVDGGESEYKTMMQPIQNVASFSKITIIIVTAFGGVILALIIMLSIKGRIPEIGMLMALGESRIKIIGQLLIEVLVTLAISLGIAMASGSVISDKVASVLLKNEISSENSAASSSDSGSQWGNRPGGFSSRHKTVQKLSSMNVSISSDNIMNMALLSLGVVVAATILPSIIIMRYNPKKILSNHS